MKNRNELQKEVEELQKTLSGISDFAYKSHEMNYVLRTENKQLQSELEKSKENTERLNNLLEIQETEIEKFNDIANCHTERYKQLKSKSLFQLIRWWYNAKN